MGFGTMSPGVFDLLANAESSKADKRYSFYLSGDLCQMSTQNSFLIRHGFSVGRSNAYPLLREEDVPKALRLIYDYRVEGWWHYKEKYVQLGICTGEEFDEALRIQCERSRHE